MEQAGAPPPQRADHATTRERGGRGRGPQEGALSASAAVSLHAAMQRVQKPRPALERGAPAAPPRTNRTRLVPPARTNRTRLVPPPRTASALGALRAPAHGREVAELRAQRARVHEELEQRNLIPSSYSRGGPDPTRSPPRDRAAAAAPRRRSVSGVARSAAMAPRAAAAPRAARAAARRRALTWRPSERSRRR